jgi:hypothetical protein
MRNIILVAIFTFLAIGALLYPSWQSSQAQLAIAEERVREVVSAGTNNISFDDLAELRRLPANIGDISNLVYLSASETNLKALSGIEGITTLQQLDLNMTQVSDLTPLTGLPNLRLIYLYETWVADLEPLTTLPSLERLDIGKTQIASLAPLTRIENLRSLNLHRSHALDGSRDYLESLAENPLLDLSGGSAYQENYRPGWQYNMMLRFNRFRERFGI